MKQVTVASKALTLIFAALFMVACSNTDTSKADAEAERITAEQAQMEADEAAKAARMAEEARMAAEKQALQDAVDSAGDTVYFGFDEFSLSAASRAVLDAHIALAKTTDTSVRLEGHTDERGTREYNMALGERRAKAVADYMAANGVASYRVETVSYGEERPEAQGSGEATWSQNRRVVIK